MYSAISMMHAWHQGWLRFEIEHQAGVNAARAAGDALGLLEAEAAHVWPGAGKLWKELI
jgi:hypothetical protein